MKNEKIAVIDVETTYENNVVSVGVVIGDARTFEITDERYFVFTEHLHENAIFADRIYKVSKDRIIECMRMMGISSILDLLEDNNVKKIYAYNAKFDKCRLPELCDYEWYDIASAARNPIYYNSLPCDVELTSNGLLKKYSAQLVLQMLRNDLEYEETHNGLLDAIDEFDIMRLLNADLDAYKLLA